MYLEYAYIGQPYSHPDAETRNQRYLQALSYMRQKMLEGVVVYSPIAHGHNLQQMYPDDFETDFEFWKKQDLTMLSKASSMHLLLIPGYLTSKGVIEEQKFAKLYGIPVEEHYFCKDTNLWKRNF